MIEYSIDRLTIFITFKELYCETYIYICCGNAVCPTITAELGLITIFTQTPSQL